MTVKIEKSIAKGIIKAPPSKSMAHRALICGALSEGAEIGNLAYSKDIQATHLTQALQYRSDNL